ncbi:hypothetical protein PIROE2DRAFT_14061, partial [Piromyces sp. E2]
NKPIIYDYGYFKLLLFSTGFILFYIGSIFLSYESYSECATNFFFKHSGILLFLLIYLFTIYINLELGKGPDNRSKSQFTFEDSEEDEPMSCISADYRLSVKYNTFSPVDNGGPIDIGNPNKYRMSTLISKKNVILKSKVNESIKSTDNIEINEDVLKKIRKIQSVFVEEIVFYSVILIIFIIIIFFKGNNDNSVLDLKNENNLQNKNGEWSYECSLENIDVLFNLMEFIILLLILIKGNQLLNFENVFRCTRYITYSSIVGIITGPTIN